MNARRRSNTLNKDGIDDTCSGIHNIATAVLKGKINIFSLVLFYIFNSVASDTLVHDELGSWSTKLA